MREKIEHRIGMQASAEAIWAVLSDLSRWSEWNPLYPRAEGALRIGERLDLDLALPGRSRRRIRPTIVDWVPNEQIHWKLSMFGGLMRTVRYFEIEQLAPGSCIFSNGELFDGALGPLVARRMRKTIRAGFASLGEALKARVMGERE